MHGNNNYEAPSVEFCKLSASEEMLANPTVSIGGVGFEDRER